MLRLLMPLVGLALIVIWVMTIVRIIRTPDHLYRAGNQIVWLVVVVLIPFIGVPLYYILGAPETGPR